ncbi:hypothetical protein D3C78_1875350 [compost metagenome]
MCFNLYFGIDVLQSGFGRFRFGHTPDSVLLGVQLLALQIAPLHIITVGKNQASHSTARQCLGNPRAKRSSSNNKYTGTC